MKSIEENFSLNLRKRRKELCLTQKELAQMLKYSEKSISKWETAEGMPPAQLLPKLATVLKTTIDELMYESAKIDYFLGIDGGGTKTEFALADKSGKIIKRIILGGCNPVDIGFDEATKVIANGIDAITDGISPRRISVFAGIAGGITGDNKEKLDAFLDSYKFAKHSNGSDAENAVAAGLQGGDGVAVIMGTGSIAFASVGGKLHRIGGYGYLLGDAGSGFAIGSDGIFAALTADDGSGEKTMLNELILRRFEKKKVLECVSDFYAGGKRFIAEFAMEVFEAASLGDSVAYDIIDKNMHGVCKLITAGIDKVYSGTPVRVVLLGGITRKKSVILPLIEKNLNETNKKCELSVYEQPMVNGALLLAGIEVK